MSTGQKALRLSVSKAATIALPASAPSISTRPSATGMTPADASVEVKMATAIELCRMVAEPAPANNAMKRFFNVLGRILRISAP